jgi:hypothetical protein
LHLCVQLLLLVPRVHLLLLLWLSASWPLLQLQPQGLCS